MSRRALLVAAAALCALASDARGESVGDGRLRMGTVLEVQLEGAPAQDARALLDALYAEVAAEETLFSSFDAESAVSALNAHSGEGAREVPALLARLLAESKALGTLTRGTFDITVAPLVRLWAEAGKAGQLPSADAIAATRRHVGAANLVVDLEQRRVTLAHGSSVDIGGIAKGFALDRCAELLDGSPALSGALLSFGQSSLYARGRAPDGVPWRVALRHPRGGFVGVIELHDTSLSVSESLGQDVEIGGRRFGHVLDPRSGRPLERPALAAVVSSSGTRAEALSKALLILGAREGIALLEHLPDAQGMLVEADGRLSFTEGFRAATRFEPLSDPQPTHSPR